MLSHRAFRAAPRTKTPAQVCRELDTLFRLGYRGWVDFVDDNFIGNKKDTKRLLPVLVDWCKKHDYPFFFSTEVSLNLAEEPELMEQMAAADFRYVFTGIESAEEEVLLATQKPINTQRPVRQRIRRLHPARIARHRRIYSGIRRRAGELGRFHSRLRGRKCAAGGHGLVAHGRDRWRTDAAVGCGRPPDGLCGQPIGVDEQFEMRIAQSADSILDQTFIGLNFVTTRDRKTILKDQIRIIGALLRAGEFTGERPRRGRGSLAFRSTSPVGPRPGPILRGLPAWRSR